MYGSDAVGTKIRPGLATALGKEVKKKRIRVGVRARVRVKLGG
jgi:hypothetical protein